MSRKNLNIRSRMKMMVMRAFSVHRPDGRPDIFIFSTPRSGSTWLMELFMSQPGFKYCDEPFNIRTRAVRELSGIADWRDLFASDAESSIEPYIRSFINGRPCHARLKHALPLGKDYRPVTRRIVFKILHTGKDRMDWFQHRFNAKIVYMLRHPIPVALSRRTYPRLEVMRQTPFARHFSSEQLRLADEIIENGSRLQRGVLSWCLQNKIPLSRLEKEWIVVTYEQLVVDPVPIVDRLMTGCQLNERNAMIARLPYPSETTWQSDDITKEKFNKKSVPNTWFIEKWRDKVDDKEEKQAMDILLSFDIEAYRYGSFLPSDDLWIGNGNRAI
jgi:hypothetical protein